MRAQLPFGRHLAVCASAAGLAATLTLAAGCKSVGGGISPQTTLKADDETESAPGPDNFANVNWVNDQTVLVDIGNKSSFEQKLALIDSAQTSLRVAYFIFGFDDSSSLLVKKLVDKAAQGVDVRIIVDGMTAQKNRDNFRMMIAQSQKAAATGGKPIQVMYFRPMPDEVWQDLASWGFKDRSAIESAAAGLEADKLNGILASNQVLKENPALRVLVALLMPTNGARPDLVTMMKNLANGQLPGDVTFDSLATNLFKGLGKPELTFHPKAWLSLIKRFHHKAIIADDRRIMGGGRNIEDHYHTEVDFDGRTDANDPLLFMDADYLIDSPELAKTAAAGFDGYWACGDDYGKCTAKIAMLRETVDPGKTFDDAWMALSARAAKFSDGVKTYAMNKDVVLHDGQFSGAGVKVGYLENRMVPIRKNMEKFAFGEEPSRYNAVWEDLIGKAKEGDDIVIHNAYVLLPPAMHFALFKALTNGATARLITNSDTSSNHNSVNMAANAQYAAMLKIADRIGKARNAAVSPLKIYQYDTKETLHTKIELIGDYMIVGSTNSDPRSKILDTQNGLVIGPGANGNPIAAQYRQWLDQFLTRQRDGKSVLKELTLAQAVSAMPDFEKVKAAPDSYKSEQQFNAYAVKFFETAMDPASAATATARLYSGFLNTLFLNL